MYGIGILTQKHLMTFLSRYENYTTIRDYIAANEEWWTEDMPAASSLLFGHQVADAVTIANETGSQGPWAQDLSVLSHYFLSRFLSDIDARARQTANDKGRIEALMVLIPHLPESLQYEMLREVISVVRKSGLEITLTSVLTEMASCLPQRFLPEVLGIIQTLPKVSISDRSSRACALTRLANYLQGQERIAVLVEALTDVLGLPEADPVDGNPRNDALVELVPYLPRGELGARLPRELVWEVLGLAEELPEVGPLGQSSRTKVLVKLASHLSGEERERVLRKALTKARTIGDADGQAKALVTLAPHLSPRLLSEALEAVQEIEDVTHQVEALADLALYVSREEQERVLEEVLKMVTMVWDPAVQSAVLVKLATHLFPSQLVKALELARAIGGGWPRALALAAVAPHAPAQEHVVVLEQALEAARAVPYERERQSALVGLVGLLTRLDAEHLYCLWRDTLHILAGRPRAELLSDIGSLIPIIQELGGEEAIAETFHAIQDVGRWWP